MTLANRITRRLNRALNRSDLDSTIPPEICGDGFAELITEIASFPDVRTAIDVGASGGGGSSAAIYEGLKSKSDKVMVCLELSEPRFKELNKRFREHDWVVCLNESSIGEQDFPSFEEVSLFLKKEGCRQMYGKDESDVLRWLRQDLDYIRDHNISTSGILNAFSIAGVETFDLAVIDGSEFSGLAEMRLLMHSAYLLLDDVNTFKNMENRRSLLASDDYELIREDLDCRNGFSAFRLLRS